MTSPLVSVVMSVYNGERYLREAVDSILKQTFTNFEFIIINDGSTDGTRSVLESYSDARIILHNQSNMGLTKSLNRGISLSKGHYIARQDADDISKPDRLEKQLAFMQEHPSVGLLGSRFEFIDESGQVKRKAYLPLENIELQRRLLEICQFCHSSVIVRKEVLDSIGYYREFFKYTQDYDLWLRIAEKWEIHNLPDFLIGWRESTDAISSQNLLSQTMFAGVAANMARQRRAGCCDDLQKGEIPTFPPAETLSEDLVLKLIQFYSTHPEDLLNGLHEGKSSADLAFLFKRVCADRLQLRALEKERDEALHRVETDLANLRGLLSKYEKLSRLKERELRSKDQRLMEQEAQLREMRERCEKAIELSSGQRIIIQNKFEHIGQLEENVRSEQQQVANAIRALNERESLLRAKDERIMELLNSMSWRITAPIRAVFGLLSKRQCS